MLVESPQSGLDARYKGYYGSDAAHKTLTKWG